MILQKRKKQMTNIQFGPIKQDVTLEGTSTGIVVTHLEKGYIISHPKQDLMMSKIDNQFYPITAIRKQEDWIFESLEDAEKALFNYFSFD